MLLLIVPWSFVQTTTAFAVTSPGKGVTALQAPNIANRTLTSPNAQSSGEFGYSVAADGNLVVVGAPGETVNGYQSAGRVYLYSARSGALLNTLTSPNVQETGDFGWSVAVNGKGDGRLLVVGAWGESADGHGAAGHAYTYNATTGSLISTLTSPNPQDNGEFGWSVAVSGNTILGKTIGGKIVVVGADEETVDGYEVAGRAYTFNAKSGALVATFTSPNAQTGGAFGSAVAIEGKVIFVGAPCETVDGYIKAGNAYSFDALTGALVNTYTSLNAQMNGIFGGEVAVGGGILLVGATGETVDGYVYAGRAYAFDAATGSLINTLTSPNAQYAGAFGSAVAISGSTALVGANAETSGGYMSAGNAYTFDVATGTPIGTYTTPNPTTTGDFGKAAAIEGSVLLVGAYGESVGGYKGAGHAYIF